MGYDYYLHRNRCFIDNYFGRIGKPVKVSATRYYLWKAMGYRATKVKKGTPVVEVIVQAAINSGYHPNSYHVEKIRETGADEE